MVHFLVGLGFALELGLIVDVGLDFFAPVIIVLIPREEDLITGRLHHLLVFSREFGRHGSYSFYNI